MKNFQKIALALIVGVMAIGFSAFKSANKPVATHYGITAQSASTYTVEVFDEANKDCETTQVGRNCSLYYPTAGQTSISRTDPNISSLVTGKIYQ